MGGEPFEPNDDTSAGASGLRGVGGGDAPLVVGIGDRLDGRYTIEAALGRGGMGYVFEATDERLQRPVAIKVIRPEFARHPDVVARFEREALASSRLTSPNVVVVHDFGRTSAGLLYLVMERLEGVPLARRLKKGPPMPVDEALRVGHQIARALEAAHNAAITHRDLKPANVFLCDDGTAKVLDFGIAKIAESGEGPFASAGLTSTGMMLGTPLFMSPEAASPNGTVGPPSDVYALGTILFSMLTGRTPFLHEEPVVVMSMHMTQPAPTLLEAAPFLAVGSRAEHLLARMLHKDGASRPTATETLEALEALIADPMASSPIEEFSTDFDEASTTVDSLPSDPVAPPPSDLAPLRSAAPTSAAPADDGFTVSVRALVLAALGLLMAVGLIGGIGAALIFARSSDPPAAVSATPLERTTAAARESTSPTTPALAPTPIEEPAPIEIAPPEPAPAAPAAETGHLVVTARPPAQVTLDGEALGRTPVEADVAVGVHRLVLQRGAQSEERRVEIEAGETSEVTVRFRRASRPTAPSGGSLDGIPDEW